MKQVIRPRGMSPDGAATYAGVCRDTIYGWMKVGRLRYRKMGRRTIILSEDVDEVLESLPVGEVS